MCSQGHQNLQLVNAGTHTCVHTAPWASCPGWTLQNWLQATPQQQAVPLGVQQQEQHCQTGQHQLLLPRLPLQQQLLHSHCYPLQPPLLLPLLLQRPLHCQ
jgi:hypothetical protein